MSFSTPLVGPSGAAAAGVSKKRRNAFGHGLEETQVNEVNVAA